MDVHMAHKITTNKDHNHLAILMLSKQRNVKSASAISKIAKLLKVRCSIRSARGGGQKDSKMYDGTSLLLGTELSMYGTYLEMAQGEGGGIEQNTFFY